MAFNDACLTTWYPEEQARLDAEVARLAKEKRDAKQAADDAAADTGDSSGAIIAIIVILCLAAVAGILIFVFRGRLKCCKKQQGEQHESLANSLHALQSKSSDDSSRKPSVNKQVTFKHDDEAPKKKKRETAKKVDKRNVELASNVAALQRTLPPINHAYEEATPI